MRTFILFAMVMTAALSISCSYTAAVKSDIVDYKIFDAPLDKVWTATVGAITDSDYNSIENIEKDSGLITTGYVSFRGIGDQIANKPKISLGTWSQGRYRLNILIVEYGENKAKVTVKSIIEGFEDNVTGSWHLCHSKGVLEENIFNEIGERL